MSPANGLILLDKPSGPTCARAVSQVKRVLPPGTRLGHAGALDAFATGLVILLAGQSTRLCEQIMSLPKRYHATIQLGSSTPTDDADSIPIATSPTPDIPTESEIARQLANMIGTIMQRPPLYSALKLRGKRSSDLARAGKPIAPEPRPVRIDAILLTHYAWPIVKAVIDCGRGTYIRAIARDLGQALNVGAHLTDLRRTRIGPFNVNDAQPLDDISSKRVPPRIIDPAIALDQIAGSPIWPEPTEIA